MDKSGHMLAAKVVWAPARFSYLPTKRCILSSVPRELSMRVPLWVVAVAVVVHLCTRRRAVPTPLCSRQVVAVAQVYGGTGKVTLVSTPIKAAIVKEPHRMRMLVLQDIMAIPVRSWVSAEIMIVVRGMAAVAVVVLLEAQALFCLPEELASTAGPLGLP